MKLTHIANRPRGFALVMVLLITFVLVILTGAFVKVNSTSLNILSNSINRSQAEEACMSAIQYAWMRLDQDQSWGTAGYFTTHPANEFWPAAQGPNARIQVTGSGNTIEGRVAGTDMTFRVLILNNLANDLPDGTNDVPKRAVKLVVDGWCRRPLAQRHADVVLRKKAFVDSSAVSQLDMDIYTVDKWNLSTADPLLNMVRSNAYIKGPGVGSSAATSQIQFHAYGPSAADGPFGSALAKSDILVGGTSLGGSTTERMKAQGHAKGQFLPNTGAEYKIPELTPADLNGPAEERVLPGGTYEFRIAGIPVPAAAATADTVDPLTGEVIVGTPAVAGYTLYEQSLVWRKPNGQEVVIKTVTAPTGTDDKPQPLNRDEWVPLALDPNTGQRTDDSVAANLRTAQIVVQPGIKAVVPKADGDLRIRGTVGSGNLALGTVVPGSYDEEDDDHQDRDRDWDRNDKKDRYAGKDRPPEVKQPSSLEVQGGDLEIFGAATGWGSLVADRNIELRMKSDISTDPDVGVAIYAGKDVIMRNATLSFGVSAEGASFSGLVYSKGNFLVDAGDALDPTKRQVLKVEGAVVAQGRMEIMNARQVDFKYNPDYLYDIIKPQVGTATRLEQVSFSMR